MTMLPWNNPDNHSKSDIQVGRKVWNRCELSEQGYPRLFEAELAQKLAVGTSGEPAVKPGIGSW